MPRARSVLRAGFSVIGAGVMVGVIVVAAYAARTADPVSFATGSAGCDSYYGTATITFPVQDSGHQDAIVRITSDGATGDDGGFGGATFSPGDVVWDDFGTVDAGTAPQLSLDCNYSGSLSATLYDLPTAPATFSGVSSGHNSYSKLYFVALAAGQFVADVTIDQGSIELSTGGYGGATTVASSEEVALGALSGGKHDLQVTGRSGPTATYSVSIRELPVRINGLHFNGASHPHYASPGTIVTGSFSLTGRTTITAYVRNAQGAIVRHLGSYSAGMGRSSITWDCRGDGGSALPDGAYYLDLTSNDPNGNVAHAQTSLVIDGTPPTVEMISPYRIRRRDTISFRVHDSASGAASASLTVDGQRVAEFGGYYSPLPLNGEFSYSPPSSHWSLGIHHWRVTARDKVGNRRTISGSFDVVRQ